MKRGTHQSTARTISLVFNPTYRIIHSGWPYREEFDSAVSCFGRPLTIFGLNYNLRETRVRTSTAQLPASKGDSEGSLLSSSSETAVDFLALGTE